MAVDVGKILEKSQELSPFGQIGKAGKVGSKAARKQKWKNLKDGEKLSAGEVAQMWIDAGGKEKDAAMASAISNHESKGRTVGIYNEICCWGLMQINAQAHSSRYGAGGNEWDRMKKAVAIRRASPRQWGPNPWEVCHDAECSNLKKEAAKISADSSLSPGESVKGLAQEAAGGIEGVLAAVLEPIANFFKLIGQADTWLRILKVVGGALILLIAGYQLLNRGYR